MDFGWSPGMDCLQLEMNAGWLIKEVWCFTAIVVSTSVSWRKDHDFHSPVDGLCLAGSGRVDEGAALAHGLDLDPP